jgi:pimeloyl-ACP methyl ester carboxylesterase
VTNRFTTADGRMLSYERRGSGPLLVCHPGGPGGSAAEFRDFAGLDDTFDLVLLSPRGSAGSDPAAGYALTSYASDLDELRAHLGVERMDLLGFSHGGIVAMVYGASYPERVERLVLASTIAVFDQAAQAAQEAGIEIRRGEPWFAAAERAIADEQAGEFATTEDLVANVQQQMPLYFHRWEGHEETARELADDFTQAEPLQHFNEHEFPTFDLRADLRTIRAPTLVVTGESDFICGPVCARTIAGELRDGRLVIIPEAGHFTYIEQPGAFRGALVEFLS